MRVKDIARSLDEIAPPVLAAEWDNVGLLVGDGQATVRTLLLCIDLTREVLAEAFRARAQMVMAYHPVIFKPISHVTADAEPVVYAAVRRGVAVYSTHTALDAAAGGTNDVLADVLGLQDRRALAPAGEDKCKIIVFLPASDLPAVMKAAFDAGAGIIGNYHGCSYLGHGRGTFFGLEGTHPTVGQAGRHETVEEVRLEMVAPRAKVQAIDAAIRAAHSYETPAIDLYSLESVSSDNLGLGRVGRLLRPVKLATLIARVKKTLGVRRVLLAGTGRKDRLVRTAAVAAGSAGALWQAADQAGATLYLTGEMRHHDALAATAAGMNVVCAGHSHTERITLQRLARRLLEHRPRLRVVLSKQDRDPFEIV